jgi:hypothetical protein
VPRAIFEYAERGSYDEITLRRARAGFEQAHGLTASKLKLVNDEQLQLSIRLGELSRRLFESCEVSVWRVYLRLINLLDCPDLAGADTPVGPEGICCGLGEMCAVLPGALPDKLNLLRAVEEMAQRRIGALIVFAPVPLYMVHLASTAPWGLSPLADQQLAGLLMWVPAALPYLGVGLWLAWSSLRPREPAL